MTHASLAEKVFGFTVEHDLIKADAKVLVGVSGGADSMALLHVLHHWPVNGLRVCAVHVHHGLRGEEADRDEAFVRNYCAENGIDLHVVHADVHARAQREHSGLEEAGRRERYDTFERLRRQLGADCVATAHTASDTVETMLMHLIRGCGAGGLIGIPPKRGHIIRPLLSCTREEIEAYCAAQNVPYIVDSTNADVSFTRNRVRYQVLPLLRQMNPAVDEALLRLRDTVAQDEAYLQATAVDVLATAKRSDGGFKRAAFLQQSQSVRVRMWKSLLTQLGCFSFTEKHILALEHAANSNRGTVYLPEGYRVVVSADSIMGFAARQNSDDLFIPVDGLPLRFVCAGREHVLQRVSHEEFTTFQNVHKMFFKYSIDCDRIQGSLYVRHREDGDHFHPARRKVGKSLKKIFQELHVPIPQRETYPLLCDDDGVVLMPGVSCDTRVCPDDSTKHFLVWLVDGEPSYTLNRLLENVPNDCPATDSKE